MLGIGKHVLVAEVVTENGWTFRRCRSDTFLNIVETIRNLPVPVPKVGSDVFCGSTTRKSI